MDEFLLLSLKKEMIFGVLPRLAGAKDVGCNGRQAGKLRNMADLNSVSPCQ
jgi:hypothetical protein